MSLASTGTFVEGVTKFKFVNTGTNEASEYRQKKTAKRFGKCAQNTEENTPIAYSSGRLGLIITVGFSLKLPEWLNTNLVTVRAKLGPIRARGWVPNFVPSRGMN